MPKLTVNRSITIQAPAEKIFDKVSDFNHWQPWSPWLIQEPGVKVTVAEDSKYYEWEGDRVGAGNMTVTNEVANESVDYDLMFLKPWKSKAKVRFELKPDGDNTRVTWYMDSSLPFFMFWMKKMTEAFIGMDYERGLNLLKDYVEDGKVHSALDFRGASNFPGTKYIGVRRTCTKQAMPDAMKEDFGKIFSALEGKDGGEVGNGLTIYHKWNMVKDEIEYTAAIQVSKVPEGLPSGVAAGEIPATSTHQLGHTGPYMHLGNAWSTLYGMQRAKVFKQNKKINPFEVYENRPGEVSDNELVTVVNFPTK